MASASPTTIPLPPFPPGDSTPSYNHVPAILATSLVFLALAAIALGLRLFCKWTSNRRLWWDDVVLIASFIAFLIDVALTIYLTGIGFGKPPSAMDLGNMDKFVVAILVRGTFAITSIAWSKTGFAITMLRLTEGHVNKFVWFIIISVNLAMGISALLQWIECTPVKATWDPFSVPNATCWPKKVVLGYHVFSGAWSAAADLVLALLPWHVLSQLQMNKREKIGAGIAMSMGVIAGIVAIVKTINLPKIFNDDQSEGHVLMLWDLAETGVTIVAASIPALRVLFRHVRRGTRTNGSHPDRYALSNLKRSTPAKPNCAESQTGDLFRDDYYVPPAADARSDKGILETRFVASGRY